MTLLIRKESGSHWYLPDGTPYHEVLDGKGQLRPVTLRDARKVNAYPSVTNVLNVVAKEGLINWRIEQAILAALTLPRVPSESDTDFAHRVVEDSEQHSRSAMDRGTEIHAACEDFARDGQLPLGDLSKLIEPYMQWHQKFVKRVIGVEEVCVSRKHGYAGRVDLFAEIEGIGPCVIDLKTQRVKLDKAGKPKPSYYETWAMQLAAYSDAIAEAGFHQPAAIASLVLGSEEPVEASFKVWEDQNDHTDAFHSAFSLWKYMKGYDPAVEVKCAA